MIPVIVMLVAYMIGHTVGERRGRSTRTIADVKARDPNHWIQEIEETRETRSR